MEQNLRKYKPVVDCPSVMISEDTKASAAEDFLVVEEHFFIFKNFRFVKKLLDILLLLLVFSAFKKTCPFISRLLRIRFRAV